jgi:hypothetical protein
MVTEIHSKMEGGEFHSGRIDLLKSSILAPKLTERWQNSTVSAHFGKSAHAQLGKSSSAHEITKPQDIHNLRRGYSQKYNAMASQNPEKETGRLPMPSRNPIPLSASQEAQVRDVFHARVRRHCADEIKGQT